MNHQRKDFSKEFYFKTSRSSGKGGQHVNKTDSRISLFFDLTNSVILSEEEKNRIRNHHLISLSSSGILQIDVEKHRSQLKNKKEAIERFYELINKATKKPKPRKATKPSRAAIKKRLNEKKKHAEKKKNRKKDF